MCVMLGGEGRGVQAEQEQTLMASSQGPTIQPPCSSPLTSSPSAPKLTTPYAAPPQGSSNTHPTSGLRTFAHASPSAWSAPALEQISSASKEHLGIYNKEHSDSAGLGRARGGVCSKLLMLLLLLLVRETPLE